MVEVFQRLISATESESKIAQFEQYIKRYIYSDKISDYGHRNFQTRSNLFFSMVFKIFHFKRTFNEIRLLKV